MRTQLNRIAIESHEDEIVDNYTARRWRGLDLREAFGAKPRRDDAALVEAMGSHFDPDPTGWRWLSDESRLCDES